MLAPEGIVVSVGAVRMKSKGEVAWELEALADGEREIIIEAGGERAAFTLLAGSDVPRVVRARVGGAAFARFLNPGAAPLPADSILNSITVDYPAREIKAAGHALHWILIYLLISIAFGFSVKGLLGVEI